MTYISPRRLNVEITEEQFKKLEKLLPYGTKKEVFGCIVDDLIELVEEHGSFVLGAILSRAIKAGDFVKLPWEVTNLLQLGQTKEEKSNGHNKPESRSAGTQPAGGNDPDNGSEKEKKDSKA